MICKPNSRTVGVRERGNNPRKPGRQYKCLLHHCGVIEISRPPCRLSCPAIWDGSWWAIGGRENVCLDPSQLHVITSPEISCVTQTFSSWLQKKKKKENCYTSWYINRQRFQVVPDWPLAVDPLGPTRSDWGAHWVSWGQTNLKRFNKVSPIQFTSWTAQTHSCPFIISSSIITR